MVGVAEKETEVPAQTVVKVEEIETLTGKLLLTVIVTVFEMAGLPVTQGALEVNWQMIASEFTGTKEKLEFVAPGTLTLFTFHW